MVPRKIHGTIGYGLLGAIMIRMSCTAFVMRHKASSFRLPYPLSQCTTSSTLVPSFQLVPHTTLCSKSTSEEAPQEKTNIQQSFMSLEGDTGSDPTHHSLAPRDVSAFKPKETKSKWKFWKKTGEEGGDQATFRQKLAKMGISVLLSYGFVSNMSYCVTVSLAWYIFNKRVSQ